MRSYNPLSVDELGRNAARALMDYPAVPLAPEESFDGAGVYTVYYHGPFEAYAGMSDEEPIYVGKSDFTRSQPRRPLHIRLSEHARSVEEAANLTLADFRCRWLVLETVWIGLTEQVLIEEYRPVWNAVVAGFGNHDQGTTRRNQRRSRWDTLHPGRPWAAHYQDGIDDTAAILAAVSAHREKASSP